MIKDIKIIMKKIKINFRKKVVVEVVKRRVPNQEGKKRVAARSIRKKKQNRRSERKKISFW